MASKSPNELRAQLDAASASDGARQSFVDFITERARSCEDPFQDWDRIIAAIACAPTCDERLISLILDRVRENELGAMLTSSIIIMRDRAIAGALALKRIAEARGIEIAWGAIAMECSRELLDALNVEPKSQPPDPRDFDPL